MHSELDPHARPTAPIQGLYKQYRSQKFHASEPSLDFNTPNTAASFKHIGDLDAGRLNVAFQTFTGKFEEDHTQGQLRLSIFESRAIPGLRIVPAILPPSVQKALLSRLLHRDLSNSLHQTNVHKFYTIPYPPPSASQLSPSFFSLPPSTTPIFHPKDAAIHKPLSVTQFLTNKLRWLTLGGQYDWTAKLYPPGRPPTFPPDIAELLKAVFPDMEPEAAIVNLYSPGDTLSMHRDVSEQCDKGLVSVSMGCDAIFVIGLDGLASRQEGEDDPSETGCEQDGDGDNAELGTRVIALRLRSGDAVYMTGASRFAWHGVPKIISGTCPAWLENWPAEDGMDGFEAWRGWMEGKRVNLNVRQMFEGGGTARRERWTISAEQNIEDSTLDKSYGAR